MYVCPHLYSFVLAEVITVRSRLCEGCLFVSPCLTWWASHPAGQDVEDGEAHTNRIVGVCEFNYELLYIFRVVRVQRTMCVLLVFPCSQLVMWYMFLYATFMCSTSFFFFLRLDGGWFVAHLMNVLCILLSAYCIFSVILWDLRALFCVSLQLIAVSSGSGQPVDKRIAHGCA